MKIELKKAEEETIFVVVFQQCSIIELRVHSIALSTIYYFFLHENIRMAYGHPRSRSCGGLEGPFGPCCCPLYSLIYLLLDIGQSDNMRLVGID